VSDARPTVIEATREVMGRLDRVERTIGRLSTEPERAILAADVAALREGLQRLGGLDRDARHQLEHDVRVPLNAIAGWTYILRSDATAPGTVARAVEVFERNVRVLTRLIETYTAEGELSRVQR
jgi:signal transduction histidine kinase